MQYCKFVTESFIVSILDNNWKAILVQTLLKTVHFHMDIRTVCVVNRFVTLPGVVKLTEDEEQTHRFGQFFYYWV